jgi:hypothetical protein
MTRKNYWLWLILGVGGVLLWAKSLAAETLKPTGIGELAIDVGNFKSGSGDAVLAAILAANASCPGLPTIVKLNRGPFVAGGGAGPGPLSAMYIVDAAWTHNTLGPVKESVRACLERLLQTVNPGASVTATRLT